jgi:hypothetical protein
MRDGPKKAVKSVAVKYYMKVEILHKGGLKNLRYHTFQTRALISISNYLVDLPMRGTLLGFRPIEEQDWKESSIYDEPNDDPQIGMVSTHWR